MMQTPEGRSKLQTYSKGQSGYFGGNNTDSVAHSAGCTACSAIITQTEIIVANSGDSRAVLAKKTGDKFLAFDMSEDHKPELPEEKRRIEKAGGFVDENRVKGILALSRAIGDLEYKGNSSLHVKD